MDISDDAPILPRCAGRGQSGQPCEHYAWEQLGGLCTECYRIGPLAAQWVLYQHEEAAWQKARDALYYVEIAKGARPKINPNRDESNNRYRRQIHQVTKAIDNATKTSELLLDDSEEYLE